MESSGGWIGLATIALVFLHGVFSAWQNDRNRKRLEDMDEANKRAIAERVEHDRVERERIVKETLEFQRQVAEDLARITNEQAEVLARKVDAAQAGVTNRLKAVDEKIGDVHRAVEAGRVESATAFNSANNFNQKLATLEESLTQRSPTADEPINVANNSL